MNMKLHQINYIYDKEECSYVRLSTKEEIIFPYYSYRIIELCCMKYATTIKGRIDFAKRILKGARKIPILVRDKDCLLFFPVYGTRKKDIWVNYNSIKKIKENEKGSKILFYNDEILCLDVHITTLRKQMRRCKTIVTYMDKNIV